ncbi:porin family protein [Vibrio profundum]|uniref:hypothetical protein n=1 Tax=Vibrio profundum TaxID=2910247 RepID=UPI003D125BAC
MNTKKTLSLAIVLLASTFVTSFAANAAEEIHSYVTGGLGYANNSMAGSTYNHTAYNFGGGLLADTSVEHLQVGGELTYNYLGNETDYFTNGWTVYSESVDSYSLDFAGVANYHVNDIAYLIGKAGASYQTLDYGFTTVTDTVPMLAAGVGFNATSKTSLTATETVYFGSDDYTGQVASLMLNVKHTF